MPPIDDTAAEAALALSVGIEMNARRIVIKARCHHVFGFFDSHAISVVDALALAVVVEEARAARLISVHGRKCFWWKNVQCFRRDRLR